MPLTAATNRLNVIAEFSGDQRAAIDKLAYEASGETLETSSEDEGDLVVSFSRDKDV